MSNWSNILNEVQTYQDQIGKLNELKARYIKEIYRITGRNVIAYYSGWLRNNTAPNISINDQDMNAFMNAVYQLDKTKGLDLILHTPGGDIAATESIVNYLHSAFGNDIRAIIPQLSMSAGTMIAMSCKEIIMGRQSSLGPIDPQYQGLACQALIDEFYRAVNDVTSNPNSLGLWQAIISKYHPTLLSDCENAVRWSKELAAKWLSAINPNINMEIVEDLFISHDNSHSHSRHISREDCRGVGLNIINLEDNQDLQDAVLSLHHCYMILFDKWMYSKVVENQNGSLYIQSYSESN